MNEVFEAREIPLVGGAEKQPVIKVLVEGATIANTDHPETNQDAFFTANNAFGVFDGMGGYAGGEVASRIARDKIGKAVEGISPGSSVQDAARVLRRAFGEANNAVLQRAGEESRLRGMGTTASVAVFVENDRKVVLAHVGDSRIYLARGGQLYQITEDDSFLKASVQEGKISREEARRIQAEIDRAGSLRDLSEESRTYFNQRNVISACLGRRSLVPQVLQIEVRQGDWLLAFSDGVHDNLTSDEIERIFRGSNTPKELAQKLKYAAYQRSKAGHFRSKPDDITVVAAKVTLREPRKERNSIKNAGSFPELFEILDRTGGLQGSKRFYDPVSLRRIINRVRAGELPLDYVTRAGGLRAKVRELMEKRDGR